MSKDNASFGKASLWISRAGMWLPVSLLILVQIILKPSSELVWVDAVCSVLIVTLELVALGCGIAGRRTTDGIAGHVSRRPLAFRGGCCCIPHRAESVDGVLTNCVEDLDLELVAMGVDTYCYSSTKNAWVMLSHLS
jgi:hypothetical protein